MYEIALVNPRKLPGRKTATRFGVASGSRKKKAIRKKPKVKQMARKRTRKGKQPAGLKRYWAAHKRKHNPRKTKRRRKATGYVVGSLKKHPIKRRKLNPRRRHHARRRRHNPRLSLGGIKHVLMPSIMGAAGAVGLNALIGYVPLPQQLKTGYAYQAVKLAGAVGLGMVAGKVLGKSKGDQIALGAMTVTMYGLMTSLLSRYAPSIQLAGDDSDNMGYMSPAEIMDSGTGAYLPGGVGAYLQGDDVFAGDEVLAGDDF
jgi:hypothetical protein